MCDSLECRHSRVWENVLVITRECDIDGGHWEVRYKTGVYYPDHTKDVCGIGDTVVEAMEAFDKKYKEAVKAQREDFE